MTIFDSNGTSSTGQALPPLTKEDIRRIRESLRLSSVDAGEIIGGGPKAFIKYEKGEIQPTAAVANLLRLLEADPSALATLTGDKAPPIERADSGPFRVTGSHVRVLTDRKLVLLARRLFSAEAQEHGIPAGSIHVAENLDAADQGEDAHVIWNDGPEKTNFFPSNHCVIQLKATDVSPAQAAGDIRNTAGEIEPPIREAIEAGGTYLVLCAREFTNKQRTARQNKIRETLEAAGVAVKPHQIVFRDASQIAMWTNAHPAVATWLLEQTQPGLTGPFHGWTHWAGRHEHESSPFVADKRLEELRKTIREHVVKRRTVVRVEGGSGVGKSRLVLEALAAGDGDEVSSIGDQVIYAVEGETSSVEIKAAVQSLADSSNRAIVVVDRCSPETHRDLAAITKRIGSNLSLVIIDFEPLGSASAADATCKVSTAESSVIEGILNNKIASLPSEDLRRLLRFASGNPLMAGLLSEAWMRGDAVSTATEDSMVESIVLGRRPSNSAALLNAALRASAFGLLGVSQERERDVDLIADIGTPRSGDEMRAALEELERRGVAQRRGRLLTIQPQPIALALAERQWRQWGSSRWDQVLTGDLPAYLRVHAARRLAQLNTQPVNGQDAVAVQVAKHICRRNGPLDSMDKLGVEGRDTVMASLSEVDAETVLTLLERVTDGLSTETLKKVDKGIRRALCHALEKIAFLPQTFERAALLLLKLAVAENEKWANNATGLFDDFFPVLGGNTAADGQQRLQVLDEAARSNDAVQLKIVVKSLLNGAQTESTMRTVGAEVHGSRPALQSWLPPLWKDAWQYIDECLARLVAIAERPDEVGSFARSELGSRFRSLVTRGQIDFVESTVQRLASAHPYWPSALNSLGDVLQYDEEGLKPGVANRVRKLIADLTPRTQSDRVRFLVTEMPWDYPEDQKVPFEERGVRQTAAIEELTLDLLKQPKTISAYFPQLSQGEQRKGVEFGVALAKLSPDPLRWREGILGAYESAPPEKRNYVVLCGYLSGLAERNFAAVQAFKEMAWNSPVFAVTLPAVCFSMGITPADIALVRKSLAGGFLRPRMLGQWSFGGVLAKVPEEAIATLMDDLIPMGSEGFVQASMLLGMYSFRKSERLELLRPQLRLLAEHIPALDADHVRATDVHHFKEMMEWVLRKGPSDQDARAVAALLAKSLAANPDYDAHGVLRPLLPTLLSTYGDIAWPILGDAIVTNQSARWNFELALGDRHSFSDEKKPAILSLREDQLFGWCHAHPEVGPSFVASITPILLNRSTAASEQQFHPLALRLLEEFGDREEVLRALTANMHTFSWSGSLQNYFVLFEKPLSDLKSHARTSVRRWAHVQLQHMIDRKDDAKRSDDERDAGWEV